MGTHIDSLEFVAFDTETTGASAVADALVEVAAVRFTLEKGPLAYFQTLVNPRRPIPPFVTGIHGITDDMVAASPTIDKVLPHFFRFLEGAVPVAHNARFDVDFIAVPSLRAGIDLPQVDVLDSCRFSRRALPGLPSYSLTNLTKSLDVPTSVHHRAQADSVSCMEVFRIAVERSVGRDADWLELMAVHGATIPFHRSVEVLTEVDARLEPLLSAIRDRRRIWIEYAGGYGPREITPHTLYAKGGGR